MVALIFGALGMGLSPVLVRLAGVGPFTSAFWRTALALPILYVWMRIAERPSTDTGGRVSFSRATVLSGTVFAGDLFFWHLSIVKTSVANATFFATLAPLWVVLFGWLVFKQRVSRAVLAGLALCLLGGAALVMQSLTAGSQHLAGDLCGVATGLCFGLYFLTVQAARTTAGAARVTFELTVVTMLILAIVALCFEHQLVPHTVQGWEALVSLALFSHIGGQGLLSVALGALPAVFSSLVIFFEAIIAAIVAWAVLGEPVTLPQAIGAAFIIGGIVLARPRNDGAA